MTRDADAKVGHVVVLGLCAYALGLSHCEQPAHAQEQLRDDDVLVVAITTAHESQSIDDARGIWSVLDAIRRRHGWSLRVAARSYSPRLWAGTSRRPWVLGLTERCERPPLYPAAWNDRAREHCVALFRRVREVMSADACPVDVWGSHDDFANAHADGRHFVFVQCSQGERNLFATEVTP